MIRRPVARQVEYRASSGIVSGVDIGCDQLLPQSMRSGACATRAFASTPMSSYNGGPDFDIM